MKKFLYLLLALTLNSCLLAQEHPQAHGPLRKPLSPDEFVTRAAADTLLNEITQWLDPTALIVYLNALASNIEGRKKLKGAIENGHIEHLFALLRISPDVIDEYHRAENVCDININRWNLVLATSLHHTSCALFDFALENGADPTIHIEGKDILTCVLTYKPQIFIRALLRRHPTMLTSCSNNFLEELFDNPLLNQTEIAPVCEDIFRETLPYIVDKFPAHVRQEILDRGIIKAVEKKYYNLAREFITYGANPNSSHPIFHTTATNLALEQFYTTTRPHPTWDLYYTPPTEVDHLRILLCAFGRPLTQADETERLRRFGLQDIPDNMQSASYRPPSNQHRQITAHQWSPLKRYLFRSSIALGICGTIYAGYKVCKYFIEKRKKATVEKLHQQHSECHTRHK